jgi:Ras-related GTP-binding protein A/B
LGSVTLNLWDCGGQDNFMDSYLTHQRDTIFKDVGVLIYVFDVESRDIGKDRSYYIDCLKACRRNSPDAEIFVLLHKMDLLEYKRDPVIVFDAKKKVLLRYNEGANVKMYPTSIYDDRVSLQSMIFPVFLSL